MASLLYFGDPMCSWCYGFAPVLLRIRDEFAARVPIQVVLGGLRPGPHAEKLDDRLKMFLKHHWEEVHRTTGQEFGYRIFERDDFVYDTEPGCRAVVAVRRMNPELLLDFFSEVQEAFYRDSQDLSVSSTYIPILERLGIAKERFLELWQSSDVQAETWKDFEFAAASGVRGFPTLIYLDGERGQILCRGYLPYEDVRERIEICLSTHKPVMKPSAEACSIDGEIC